MQQNPALLAHLLPQLLPSDSGEGETMGFGTRKDASNDII